MSSSKGDCYYEAHVDTECVDAESSDSDSEDRRVTRMHWVVRYHEELAELYHLFRSQGNAMFGRCYFQLGTMQDFAAFVHKFSLLETSNGSNTRCPPGSSA